MAKTYRVVKLSLQRRQVHRWYCTSCPWECHCIYILTEGKRFRPLYDDANFGRLNREINAHSESACVGDVVSMVVREYEEVAPDVT